MRGGAGGDSVYARSVGRVVRAAWPPLITPKKKKTKGRRGSSLDPAVSALRPWRRLLFRLLFGGLGYGYGAGRVQGANACRLRVADVCRHRSG